MKKVIATAFAAVLVCLSFAHGAYAGNTYRAPITVSGYTGSTTLENFPVLVRLAVNTPAGFSYADCAADGSDIRFSDASGNLIPHEIDTWNTSGESLVWVKLSSMSVGTQFTMWYGGSAAANIPASTWSAFTGVWHMDEASGSVADATGNGLTASVQGNSANSVAVAGAVGNGRQTATSADKGYLSVPNYDSFGLGGTFTMSGWVKMSGCTQYPRVFSRKQGYQDANGWEIEMSNGSMANFAARGINNSPAYSGTFSPSLQNSWSHLAFVYSGATLTVYQNGAQIKTGAITAATDNGLALSFGCDSDGSETYLQGAFDECRLMGGAASADWVKAEYDTASASGFLTFGAVSVADSPVLSASARRFDMDGFVASATVGFLGLGASSCDLYFAYAPSGSALPTYELVSSGLVAGGTFSRSISGLEEGAEYTYSFIASNNLERTTTVTGTFTTGIDFKRPDPDVAEFSRGVKFTVKGYAGTQVLTNFPVLVRLSQDSPTGFSYADFYNPGDVPGADLCFLDAAGNPIPHEIDTWNTAGESLVWVTLPRMTNGTEFAMWYRSSKSGAVVCPANAWGDYVGVWHLGETGDGVQSVYDSTVHELTGVTHANSSAQTEGRIGGSRRVSTKGGASAANGHILVSLSDTAKRAAVDSLAADGSDKTFTASLWLRPRGGTDYAYLIGRKENDIYSAWAAQFNSSSANSNGSFKPLRVYSAGQKDSESISVDVAATASGVWRKIDIVWTPSTYTVYYDGGANKWYGTLHTANGQAPINGSSDLAFGGTTGSGYGSLNGELDEVRLRCGNMGDDWVKADFDTVNNLSFLNGSEVVSLSETPKPVAILGLSDSGAKYVQFSGSIGSCGGEATECAVYCRVWKTAESEPSSWILLASGLGEGGTFSESVAGLDPEATYAYKLKATNNLDTPTDSDIVDGSFTTGGTGSGGTGGVRVRIGNDYVHKFEIDPIEGIATFEFTPPSYISSVKALVVAGGGPGGYQRGGGGGAGGLVYDDGLAVTGGATYTINVGTGGVASASASAYGSNGGPSSICLGQEAVVAAIGGGAGGNSNAEKASGAAGGNGGGGGGINNEKHAAGGDGVSGQGNSGGVSGSNGQRFVGGGGGGAGRSGSAAANDSPPSGGSGGQGFLCDISGISTWYAGGGGGGGTQGGTATNLGSPGGGGDGGGGRGGMAVPSGTVNPAFDQKAVAGTDGLGGGGGGGSDVSGFYQGANGGNGIVIIRYTVQGSGAGSDEPVVSFTGAQYAGDLVISGTYRVAWAGEGADGADVYVKWGYSPNALTHSVAIATDKVGTGAFSINIPVDKTTIYLRVVAKNGSYEGVSDELLAIYVPEYAGVVPGDHTIPVLTGVAVTAADGIFARVSGTVTSFGTPEAGEDPITGCTVYAYVGTSSDPARMTKLDEMPVVAGEAFSYAITNLAVGVQYYWYLEAKNSAGHVVATAVDSFTTVERSLFSSCTASTEQRKVTISGSLLQVGAGTTYVLYRLKYSTDASWPEWSTMATFNVNSTGKTFSKVVNVDEWGSLQWQTMCSNECVTATGEPTGVIWTDSRSGSIAADDKSVYTWQPVDGEWSGSWTNAAHWSCDKADNRGYPQSSNATASFENCTLANPVAVDVPGAYTVGAFRCTGSAASDISFVGTGKSASRITSASLPQTTNDTNGAIKPNTRLEFRDMTLSMSAGGFWTVVKGASGTTNVTLRFSGAELAGVSSLVFAAPYSSLEFLGGSSATFGSKMSVGGTNTVVTIDDSTVNAKSIYIPADADGPGMKVRLRGTNPLLKQNHVDGDFSSWAQSWPVVYEFQVPQGGFASAPLQHTSTAHRLGQLNQDDASGATPTFSFAVAEDSPALTSPGTISNNVIVQTASGFYTDFMANPLGTLPAGATGAVKYGVSGAETDDALEARQILLDLKGNAPRTMIIIW